MESLSYEEFKKRYGTVGLAIAKQPPKPNWGQRVTEQFKSGLSYAKEGVKGLSPLGLLDPRPKQMLKNTEALGKIGSGVLQSAFSPVTATVQPVLEPTLGRGMNAVANKIADNPSVQKFASSKAGELAERGVETVRNYSDIAGAVVGPKVAGRTLSTGANAFKRNAQAVAKQIPEDVSKIRKIIEPKAPLPDEAMGQVLQGKSTDIPTGFKALKNLDLKDVKTYSEFANKIDEGIGTLAKEVDDVLDLDQTLFKRKDLLAEAKTAAGKVVKTDYLARGLNQLKELYTKIGDDVSLADLNELIKKVKTEGLTRKQVNDLARTYGQEFSSKAFGKLGDPLTSINAQLFETTRKGLKEIARKGMAGTKAEIIDKNISSLYRVQGLIKKNAEAVNKLNQKIQERGLMEKIGNQAGKALDILSGGSLRGLVGGLLPRGAGYKVMNALDLEKVLNRNLQIIEKALKDDNALQDVLKKLNK